MSQWPPDSIAKHRIEGRTQCQRQTTIEAKVSKRQANHGVNSPGVQSPVVDGCGHTDSTGGYEYNLELSQKRADSVSSYLAAQGVQSVRLLTRGYGPDRPIGDNATADGRQQNRRVEIVLEPITA